MPYSNISAVLSDAERDAILAKLKEAWELLPFLINLTADEKKALPKMGDKSVSFVEKSLDYAGGNPNLIPPYLDAAELKKDVTLVKQLQPIYNFLNQFFDAVDNTFTAVGSEAYVESLTFYNTVRDASKRNVPGADAIYQDLRQRFPGRPTAEKAVPPQMTAAGTKS